MTMVQPATPDGAPVPGLEGGAFSYRPVGTRIDSFARSLTDDRYRVTVIIEETSAYGEDSTAMESFLSTRRTKVFRSFESSNTLVLRDGQSRQYTAEAGPALTCESIRVDAGRRFSTTRLPRRPAAALLAVARPEDGEHGFWAVCWAKHRAILTT